MVHDFGESKPVADLCHAPLVLAAAGVLGGRTTAAYPALAPDMAQAGAEFVDSDAVVDGVVVSARAWPDHPGWMREFLRVMRDHARSRADAPPRQGSWRMPMTLPSASFTVAIRRPPPTSLISCWVSAPASRSRARVPSMSSTCQ